MLSKSTFKGQKWHMQKVVIVNLLPTSLLGNQDSLVDSARLSDDSYTIERNGNRGEGEYKLPGRLCSIGK